MTGAGPLGIEMLIAASAKPRKRLYGSEATQEVLRRYGLPDTE